jgi:hypothetical protein
MSPRTGRLIFGFLVLATVIMRVGFRVDPVDETPCCTDSTLISFELAQSPEEASSLLAQPDIARQIRRNLIADSFLFLPAYTLFFGYLGLILTRRKYRFALVLGSVAAVAALATGVMDAFENWFAIQVISHATQSTVSAMRIFSLLKWLGFATTVLLLVPLFLPAAPGPNAFVFISGVIGVCFLLSGVLGLWGTVATLVTCSNDPGIETAMAPLLLSAPFLVALYVAYKRRWPLGMRITENGSPIPTARIHRSRDDGRSA